MVRYSTPMQTETTSTSSSNVVICGGGFGGLYTAIKLGELLKDKQDTKITLIDSKDRFVFLPLLYELAVGTASVQEVSPRYDALLTGFNNIEFIKGTVTETNMINNELSVSQQGVSTSIKYDQLVMAVGTQPRFDLVNGAKEFAVPFYRVEDAHELKLRLRSLKDSDKDFIRVVVLGGGYSGVEVATSVAKSIGRKQALISIIQRNERILPTSPDNNREVSEKALLNLGVSVNCNTMALRVTETGVIVKETLTGDEYEIPADLVISTAGTEQSSLVKDCILSKDKYGRILIDRSLQSVDFPNVFALGDCSGIDSEKIPTTAQVAMQQSDIVARNLAYRVTTYAGEDILSRTSRPGELEKFRFVSLGEMLTLGNTNAAITSLGGLVKLQGPLAALGRRVAYAARMPTRKQSVQAIVSAGVSQANYLRQSALSLLKRD